jgi:hypothetical protein
MAQHGNDVLAKLDALRTEYEKWKAVAYSTYFS